MAFPPTSKTHMHTVHYIADCIWPTMIHFLKMGLCTPQQSIWTNYVCADKLMAPFQNDFLHFTSFVFLVHIVCVVVVVLSYCYVSLFRCVWSHIFDNLVVVFNNSFVVVFFQLRHCGCYDPRQYY